jgi:MFS family permease
VTESSRSGGAVRRALRHRGFRLLAAASLVSNLGTWIYQIAFVAYLFAATHSTAWVAAAAVARMVPTVALAPVAGALADRLDRRRLMVASDLIRAALMVLLALLVAHDAPPAPIVAVAAAGVVLGSAYSPSISAELPELLGDDDLAAGNATNGLLWNVTMFAGPALGGLLLLVTSASTAILINAGSFLVSAFTINVALAGRTYTHAAHLRSTESLLTSTAGGAQVLLGDRIRRAVTLVCLGGYFVYGALTVLLVAVAEQSLHTGGHGYGLLIAAFGAGGVIASFGSARIAGSSRAASGLFVALALSAVPVCLVGIASSLWVAIAMVFLVGVGLCVVDITGITILQRLTPSTMLGRAFGMFDSLNYAMTLLGAVVAPPLVQAFGVRGTVVAFGVAVPVLSLGLVPALQRADATNAAAASSLSRRVAILAGTELFGPCPQMSLERLAAQASTRTVKADEVVVREGDPADDLYIVLEGALAVVVGGHGGPVRTLGVGDAFGEIGLLTDGARTATVSATSHALLLQIPGSLFVDCVQATPTMAEAVGGVVTSRLAHARPRGAASAVAVGTTS